MSLAGHADPADLLGRARAGDGQALGRLLELYRGYLLLLAQMQIDRRMQQKVDAADMVQETFLEAYRDFGQFQGTSEGQLVAWLRQVLARNLANLLRHYLDTQARNARLEQDLVLDLDQSSQLLDRALVAPGNSPSESAARREQAVVLATALQQLSKDYRDVIVLRNVQGLSFAEIGERLGRSVDSVEKLWVRGLARLRRAFPSAS